MKRSDALKALSRDHHHGLTAAQRLKRVQEERRREARDAFLEFWTHEGAAHFRAEEDVLLPALAGHAPADHEAVVRVLVDHVEIRHMAAILSDDPDPKVDELRALGERLERHIRHEERVLFPLIEETVPEDELERLATALDGPGGGEAADAGRPPRPA